LPDIDEVGRISYEIAVPMEIMTRLKQLKVTEGMIWEVDSIIPSFTVRDETGRPAFPHVFMGIDTTSHLPVIAPGIATGHPPSPAEVTGERVWVQGQKGGKP